jgi:hypothetical protein
VCQSVAHRHIARPACQDPVCPTGAATESGIMLLLTDQEG